MAAIALKYRGRALDIEGFNNVNLKLIDTINNTSYNGKYNNPASKDCNVTVEDTAPWLDDDVVENITREGDLSFNNK